jgi:hypothetical protein
VERSCILLESEKRNYQRFTVKWSVTILSAGQTIHGETRNISESGILICTKEPVGLNKEYTISLFPPNMNALELNCTVVWSDLYGIDPSNTVYGVGLCFVKFSDKDLYKIRTVMPDDTDPA